MDTDFFFLVRIGKSLINRGKGEKDKSIIEMKTGSMINAVLDTV